MQQSGGLPGAYQKVNYIQSDGNAYLDTEIVISDAVNANVYLQYELVKSFSHIMLFSNIKKDISFEYRYGYRAYVRFGYWYAMYVCNFDNLGSTLNVIHTVTQNTDNKLEMDGVISDTLRDNTNESPASSLYLFAGNTLNGANEIADGCRIYQCKIYDNGALVWNGIPCVRISDDKPGMYDTVSKTFYANAGTGEFIVPST